MLIILFIEWFYNHPALRYGGYYIIAILFFIPLSKILSNYTNESHFKTRVICIILLSTTIFFYRNIDRIIKENKQYNYSPIKTVFYEVNKKKHFRVEKEFNDTLNFYKNCTKRKIDCKNENKLLAHKQYGKFVFVISSKFIIEEYKGKTYLKKK